jgi:uncharacterized protein (DUF1778 family)
MVVQLSIRLDPELRERVRLAARRRGTTVQEFVVSALDRALSGPSSDDTPQLAEARRRLAAAIDSGAYSEYVEGIDDPELRTE